MGVCVTVSLDIDVAWVCVWVGVTVSMGVDMHHGGSGVERIDPLHFLLEILLKVTKPGSVFPFCLHRFFVFVLCVCIYCCLLGTGTLLC